MGVHSGIPARRKKRSDAEYQMQSALFSWARMKPVIDQYRGIELLEGSMNGVYLTPAQAGKAKAAGMLKGAHDVTLPVARGRYIGLSIELKVGKNKPSDEQIEYGNRLKLEGWVVLYVWDDWLIARDAIVSYLSSGSVLAPVES